MGWSLWGLGKQKICAGESGSEPEKEWVLSMWTIFYHHRMDPETPLEETNGST